MSGMGSASPSDFRQALAKDGWVRGCCRSLPSRLSPDHVVGIDQVLAEFRVELDESAPPSFARTSPSVPFTDSQSASGFALAILRFTFAT